MAWAATKSYPKVVSLSTHAAAPGTTDWSCARALIGGCALAAPPSPGRIQCLDRVPAKAGKSDGQSGKPLGRARRAGFVIRSVA